MRAPPIPSSLNWLIQRHARIQGELIRITKDLDLKRGALSEQTVELVACQNSVSALKTCLKALQHTEQTLLTEKKAVELLLEQHELSIRHELIHPISSQRRSRTFKHGGITAAIFESFKILDSSILSSTEIASYVAIKLNLATHGEEFSDFKRQLKGRLTVLKTQNRLIQCGNRGKRLERIWRLPT